jgi:AcrR family transcriptional regulator
MPYPSQVQPDVIIQRAAEIIEAEGVESLALAKLATMLGIKAPSLYHHFSSKNALLRAVNLRIIEDLTRAMQVAAAAENEPHAQLMAVARSYRLFVHSHPACYALALGRLPEEARPDASLLEQLALPFQATAARLSGEMQSLAALRGLWALVHGFSLLECNGQFRRGGDLDDTFEQVVAGYLRGIAS